MSELAEGLRGAQRRFLAAVEGVETARLEAEPVCGTWSVRDLATHLAAWNEEIVRSIEHQLHGRPPVPHHPILDFDGFNARVTAAKAPWASVKQRVDASVERAAELAAPLSDQQLDRPADYPWGDRGTLRGLFHGVDEHQLEHIHDMERVFGR